MATIKATRKTPAAVKTEEVKKPDQVQQPSKAVAEIHALRKLPVPDTLLADMHSARATFELVLALADRVPVLEAEMAAANKGGSIALARAFVVIYKLKQLLEEFDKSFSAVFEKYKTQIVPETFERDKVPNVPLTEGIRVGISHRTFASVMPDCKAEAYQHLKETYPEIVTETVNSSTLSALAKQLLEEENIELPGHLFKVTLIPTTSVTVMGKKGK